MAYALGRNVHHDPRSLAYKVKADGTAKSVEYARNIPILDQGDLGSCTGNAGTGWLGTAKVSVDLSSLNENYAVQLYSDATKIDSDPQNYPPTDTGSDGLSIAKVLQARGLISGYQHVTSYAAALTAIQSGPFIVGINWYNDMFKPNSQGVVSPTGGVAGGHEILCRGFNADSGLWKFDNSWGSSWGVNGSFFMTGTTFTQLLAQDGDATLLIPSNQPAPTPTPTPAPVDNFPYTIVDDWADSPHVWSKATKAAKAYKSWRS